MNLLAIEFRRIARRRITLVAIACVIAIVGVVGVNTFRQHKDAPPDLAVAEEQAALQEASCLGSFNPGDFAQAEMDDMCHVDPQWLLVDTRFQLASLLGGDGQSSWSSVVASQARQDFGQGEFTPAGGPTTNPASGRGGVIPGVAMMAVFITAILGASFIGAEWRAGTIESQLVWEPDRRRLLAAKLTATGVFAAGFVAFTVCLSVLTLLPSAIWRGSTANTGMAFWFDVLDTTGRAALLGAVLAMLAAAVASTARNTVAGVGAIYGLALVGLILSNSIGWLAGIDLFTNAAAWVSTGDVSHWATFSEPTGGTSSWQVVDHGWMAAGLVVAAYAAAAIGTGSLAFARRDVS